MYVYCIKPACCCKIPRNVERDIQTHRKKRAMKSLEQRVLLPGVT